MCAHTDVCTYRWRSWLWRSGEARRSWMQSGQSAMRSVWREKGPKQACGSAHFSQALILYSTKRGSTSTATVCQHEDGHLWHAVTTLYMEGVCSLLSCPDQKIANENYCLPLFGARDRAHDVSARTAQLVMQAACPCRERSINRVCRTQQQPA